MNRRLLLLLVGCIAFALAVSAQTDNVAIKQLQSEMYQYFSTPEQDKFFDITSRLKEACRKAGDEQT